MFTGIIEQTGSIQRIESDGDNRIFWITSDLTAELKVDQSVSHNGVCLTVEAVEDHLHRVTAIAETLEKTTIGNWKIGDLLNLERCMQFNRRLDGHIVQGHVDTTAQCTSITDKNGSHEFRFQIDPSFAQLIIEKGSISINGISLTLFNITDSAFTVAVIPYTLTHTCMQYLCVEDHVNIEFDIIGKYVNRIAGLHTRI